MWRRRRSSCDGPFSIVAGFVLGGWDVADGFQQPAMIEPVRPIERGEFDGLKMMRLVVLAKAPPRSSCLVLRHRGHRIPLWKDVHRIGSSPFAEPISRW